MVNNFTVTKLMLNNNKVPWRNNFFVFDSRASEEWIEYDLLNIKQGAYDLVLPLPKQLC